MKVFIGFVVLALTAASAPAARPPARPASATCFCKMSSDNLSGQSGSTGIVMEITGEINHTYSGMNPQNNYNQEDCRNRCRDTAAGYFKSPAVAAAACAAGVAHNTYIRAFSQVGVKAFKEAHAIGVLNNTPPQTVTTCTCPAGWYNNANVLGGITPDGRCKKLAGKSIGISPLPPDGTAIGSWGFTWGDELWAYSTPQNGGAPACITVVNAPAVCQFF